MCLSTSLSLIWEVLTDSCLCTRHSGRPWGTSSLVSPHPHRGHIPEEWIQGPWAGRTLVKSQACPCLKRGLHLARTILLPARGVAWRQPFPWSAWWGARFAWFTVQEMTFQPWLGGVEILTEVLAVLLQCQESLVPRGASGETCGVPVFCARFLTSYQK